MNQKLKAFLRVMATLFLWGGPLVGLLAAVGTLITSMGFAQLAVAGFILAYCVVGGLIIGGLVSLLVSIDDRLERLEGKL